MINKIYILVFIFLAFFTINIHAIKFHNLINIARIDAEFEIKTEENNKDKIFKTFLNTKSSLIIKCDNDFSIIISGEIKKDSLIEKTFVENFFNIGEQFFFDCIINQKTGIRIGRQKFSYGTGQLLGINERIIKLNIFDGIRLRTFPNKIVKYKEFNTWNDLLLLVLKYNNGYSEDLDHIYIGGIYQHFKPLGYLKEIDLYLLFKRESNFLRQHAPFVITLGHFVKSNTKYKNYKYKHEIMYQFINLPKKSKWQTNVELSYIFKNNSEIIVNFYTRSRDFKQLFTNNNRLIKYRGNYGISITIKRNISSKIINTTNFFLFIKKNPRKMILFGSEIKTSFNYKISKNINCNFIVNTSNIFKGLKHIVDFNYSFKIIGKFK